MVLAGGVLAQPVITSQPVVQPVGWGGNAVFGVTATGAGPLTYQWQLNGTNLPNNIIHTIIGGKWPDRLAATNTSLATPGSVAVDAHGNLFIADTDNNLIRRVDTNGLSVIVAGNGIASFSGDGGPATNASLIGPEAVVMDAGGNLWIADTANFRIRKVDTNGIITTVAGGGTNYYQVKDNISATNSTLFSPYGLAVDAAGNLFVADTQNHRIRKVTPGGIITTVAGSGIAGYYGDGLSATAANLNYPDGIAVDASNNLYIADTGNSRIRKVSSSGTISTVAGSSVAGYAGDGGAATGASLKSPTWVTLDASNNLYIADSGNNCIRKVGASHNISTVVGNGTNGFLGDGLLATNAELSGSGGVAVDSAGNLFCSDPGNNRIRRVNTNGVINTMAGRSLILAGPVTNATLNAPYTAVPDPSGNLFVVDSFDNVIWSMDANGMIRWVAGNGIPGFAGDGGPATNACLNQPHDLVWDAAGNMYIADYGNLRIRRLDTNGIITTIAGKGTAFYSGDGGSATNAGMRPFSLTIDNAGNLFFTDQTSERIRKIDTNGTISTVAGNGSVSAIDGMPATSSGLFNPSGIAVDGAGNLYIADTANYRLRMVDTNGTIHTLAGNGTYANTPDGSVAGTSLGLPFGVAVNSAGEVFLAQQGTGGSVIKVDTNRILHVLAGNLALGLSGDGGPGKAAAISYVRNVKLSSNGNVYFADQANNCIRVVSQVDYADQTFFTLTNVTGSTLNTSNYSVVVTGASGSVTSSVVGIKLELPPVVPTFTPTDGLLGLSWSAISNLTYQLQVATNLIAPVWQDVGNSLTATNGSVSVSDLPFGGLPRFYRVRMVP